MRARRALLLAAFVFALLPAVAGAKERPWKGGPFHFFLEPRVGGFVFGPPEMRDFYDAGNLLLGLRTGVLLEPGTLEVWPGRRLQGTLSLSLDGAWVRDEGRETLFPNPDLTLTLVPMAASLEYAFRNREEPLLVPFVGAGFAAVYFREEVAALPALPEQVVQGVRFGWHGEAGLRLLLDAFDRPAEVGAREHFGVRNTWVGLRARYQNVAGFDEGIDLSGYAFDLSLLFEW